MAEYTDKQKAKMVRIYGKKMAMLALNAANGDYTAYTRLYVDKTDSTYVSFQIDFYDKNSNCIKTK